MLLFASSSVWLDSLCMGLNWSAKHRDTHAHTRKLILDIYHCIRSSLVYRHSLYLFCLFAGKQTSVCVCTTCARLSPDMCPEYSSMLLWTVFFTFSSSPLFCVNIYWSFASFLNRHVYRQRSDLRRQISSCGKVIPI